MEGVSVCLFVSLPFDYLDSSSSDRLHTSGVLKTHRSGVLSVKLFGKLRERKLRTAIPKATQPARFEQALR